MNKKRIFSIIIVIFGIISLISGVYLYYSNSGSDKKEINTSNDTNKHETEVEEVINDIFLSTDTSIEKIDSVMGDNYLISDYYVLGTDSYLRSIPNTEEDISKYEKQQEIYAEKVEERYLNETTYTVSEDSDGNLSFIIKPWYFSLYSSDLDLIVNNLLEMANVDIELIETDYDKYDLYYYEAKVKAMIILNDYLDNYNNEEEEMNFIFLYDDDTPEENQYYSLYCNLVGALSKYMPNTVEMINEQEDRVDNYINKAIASGIIDENDPLAINS